MSRVLVAILILSVSLCGEASGSRPEEKLMRWYSPDSSWGVGGFRVFDRNDVGRQMDARPEKMSGWWAYEKIAREDGDWLALRVVLKRVTRVTFTPRTKIVLFDKKGGRIESERFLFWSDQWQNTVYDSGDGPVVVNRKSMWWGRDNGGACAAAKFRAGSVRLSDVVRFEVVCAYVDSGGEGSRRDEVR